MSDIVIERKENIAWVILDRGDGRNSLRPSTLAELCDAFDALEADKSVRAIVFAARGRHFSAGADFDFLTELRSMPAVAVKDQIYGLFQGAARRIYHCPKPVVAAVQGAAITVACELALACDYRIVAPSTMFQEAWIKLGLIPPLGGLFLLPRLVGLGRASDIVLSGRSVRAGEAVDIGLASEMVSSEEALWERAEALAIEMAALPPLAFRAAKEALHHGLGSTMEREWAANSGVQSMLIGTDDFGEGLDARRTKREPSFVGL
ncbi:enoyl-CoA hydratase/isomerase family protein [Sphingopyxis fribergensis]